MLDFRPVSSFLFHVDSPGSEDGFHVAPSWSQPKSEGRSRHWGAGVRACTRSDVSESHSRKVKLLYQSKWENDKWQHPRAGREHIVGVYVYHSTTCPGPCSGRSPDECVKNKKTHVEARREEEETTARFDVFARCSKN